MITRILKYCFYFLLFTFYFLLEHCAQIVIPGGGPRDATPPRVVKYMPDSAATNFNTKTIAITFDEYIQLSDLQRELTISPPMNIQPDVKYKGKTLLIELKDSLQKNTTYCLNFGSAIRDFTESNPKTNFQYIFSTGSFIDTLKLSGTVKNAFDLKSEKGILVMLYDTYNDSVPYKKLPSYFAKTGDDGSYTIRNIRPGNYKAFALKDANS
ncbi:MAG: Ig-like domain-containing domain, partial [Bacteroidia bacterium]